MFWSYPRFQAKYRLLVSFSLGKWNKYISTIPTCDCRKLSPPPNYHPGTGHGDLPWPPDDMTVRAHVRHFCFDRRKRWDEVVKWETHVRKQEIGMRGADKRTLRQRMEQMPRKINFNRCFERGKDLGWIWVPVKYLWKAAWTGGGRQWRDYNTERRIALHCHLSCHQSRSTFWQCVCEDHGGKKSFKEAFHSSF